MRKNQSCVDIKAMKEEEQLYGGAYRLLQKMYVQYIPF